MKYPFALDFFTLHASLPSGAASVLSRPFFTRFINEAGWLSIFWRGTFCKLCMAGSYIPSTQLLRGVYNNRGQEVGSYWISDSNMPASIWLPCGFYMADSVRQGLQSINCLFVKTCEHLSQRLDLNYCLAVKIVAVWHGKPAVQIAKRFSTNKFLVVFCLYIV